MFKFIEKQLDVMTDDKRTLEDRLNAHEKVSTKLEKIKTTLEDKYQTCEITENNFDNSIREIDKMLSDMDVNSMKMSDLINLMNIREKINGCKKFMSNEKNVKIFVHDKDENKYEITSKIKDGLFIEQIK